MGSTRIQLCGRLAVNVDGHRIDERPPGRQCRLLFAYLVLNRFRASTRDELLELLWPGDLPGAADAGLSALLSKLRRVVELDGRTEVRLVLPSDAWVDLEAARDGIHRAEGAAAREDWAGVWGPARIAQHVAPRGFLPGYEGEWVSGVRRELEDLYLRALELVAGACLYLGPSELDTAERAARTLVRLAPLRESGYRHLMQVLAARDDRVGALQVYEDVRTLLREELGVSPSASTQALHRQLLG